MLTNLILGCIGLILRAAGAGARQRPAPAAIRVLGWVMCAVAAWAAAGAVGAWTPLWLLLLVGLGAALISFFGVGDRPFLKLWADVAAFVAIAEASVPSLSLGGFLIALALILGGGRWLDQLATKFSARARVWSAIAVSVLALTLVGTQAGLAGFIVRRPLCRIAYLTITAPFEAHKVVLATGSVAWLDHAVESDADRPTWGAVFFHGANSDGAHQPAAIAMRRALLEAGFVVLSVDHPGYGQSPTPALDAPGEQWDPLPTATAAVQWLSKQPNVGGIIVVGHSMGCTDVLRLLVAGAKVDGAVLCGAGLKDSSRDEYWYGRFHADRRLPSGSLSREKVQEIRGRYYDNLVLAGQIDSTHPPVLFVRFGLEHENLVATRDQLYQAIPGVKEDWTLEGFTHYLSSFGNLGIVVGNARATGHMADRLRRWRGQLESTGSAGNQDGSSLQP
ncbi:MAG: alpha/beta fold hydrolase [Phycisphaeraceae bacterium]|nr:alpha/beta fold hydrolase [Phycisphaeraceae bacterium]